MMLFLCHRLPMALTHSKHGGTSYSYNSVHILLFSYLFLFVSCTSWHLYTFGRRSWLVLSGERAVELLPASLLDAGVEIFRIKSLEQLSAGTFVILGNIRLVLIAILCRVSDTSIKKEYILSLFVFNSFRLYTLHVWYLYRYC